MTPEVAAAILNVSPLVDKATLLKAYLRRARMTHPDRFTGAGDSDIEIATTEFIRLGEARDVLLEEIRLRGDQATAPGNQPGQRPGPKPKPEPGASTSWASRPAGKVPGDERPRPPVMTRAEFDAMYEESSWGPTPVSPAPASASASAHASRGEGRASWVQDVPESKARGSLSDAQTISGGSLMAGLAGGVIIIGLVVGSAWLLDVTNNEPASDTSPIIGAEVAAGESPAVEVQVGDDVLPYLDVRLSSFSEAALQTRCAPVACEVFIISSQPLTTCSEVSLRFEFARSESGAAFDFVDRRVALGDIPRSVRVDLPSSDAEILPRLAAAICVA